MEKVKNHKGFVTLWVLILTVTIVSTLLFSLYAGDAMTNRYDSLSRASKDIRYELTVGHLWFEEILTDDSFVDIENIWIHFDNAHQKTLLIVSGVEDEESKFFSIYSLILLTKVQKISEQLEEFHSIAQERWMDKSKSGIGTNIDQRFDRVYNNLVLATEEIDKIFEEASNKYYQIFRLIIYTLIIIIVLLGIFFGIILYRHDQRRIVDLKALQVSKNEVYQLNIGLEKKVQERTKELEIANTNLKDIDKIKSMFVASMSHELRTPLNSIIGFSGMIINNMTGPITDTQKDYMQRVNRSGKHLLSLITDVIDISKIEAGKIAVVYHTFSFNDLMQEALESIETNIDEKKLILKTTIADGIELYSDRKRLMQCVLNLLSNALKYSQRGTIKVIAKSSDGYLHLSVSDTGIGISQKDMKKLFQAFVRFESKLKMLNPGTGLGLYLTKKLVSEVLQGEISARSSLDKGSEFVIKIPLQVEENENIEEDIG